MGAFMKLSTMTTEDSLQHKNKLPHYQISSQIYSEHSISDLYYPRGFISTLPTTKQKAFQLSHTTCADFSDTPNPSPFVNLRQLDLRLSPQPHMENGIGKHHKTVTVESMIAMATKRRRSLGQSPPASEANNTPPSSRLSSPSTVATSLESEEEMGDMIETQGDAYNYTKPIKVGSTSRLEALENIPWKKYHAKPYLQTPPSTISECSWRAPSTFDGSFSRSTAYCASPRSTDEDELGEIDDCLSSNDGPRHTPPSGSPLISFTGFTDYPQTLELCQDLQQTPKPWDDSSLLPDECQWPLYQISEISDSSSQINQAGMHQLYEDVVGMVASRGVQLDAPTSRNLMACLGQVISALIPAVTNTALDATQDHHCQVAEHLLPLKYLPSRIPVSETLKPVVSNGRASGDVPFDAPEPQATLEIGGSNATVASDPKNAVDEPNASQQSLDMYLKKDSVAHWSLHLPETFQETSDAQSPSTSILMATAEEDLEKRVSAALFQDPILAQALLLKLKNDLPFLLPLFCEEEESSPFEAPQFYSYSGHERGTYRKTTSNSAPSTSGSKSNVDNSITTPATSADIGRDGFEEEADDDGPSRKRARVSNTLRPGDQVRRRFRCHFHAKSPTTHCQKTCILSGWLNIHNLRGHYKASHTVVRCHRCFKEFNTKPEKNEHQLGCVTTQAPPIVERIDCVIKDKIDYILSTFRSWQLDTEDDEEMKNWITKYMGELANKDMPTDEATDPRELAKWYRIWWILFPSFQKPVPSPFQDASMSPGDMKLERWLAMFQKLVETQVDQNRPPPADIPQQIEYYKEAFRMIHRIALTESDSRQTLESGHLADVRSVSTPANSTANTIPSQSDSTPFTTPSSLYRQQSTNSEDLASSVSPLESRQYLRSSPLSFAAPPPASSMRSPCSAETSGAIGESPVIKGPLKSRKASGVDNMALSPSPLCAIDYQAQNTHSSQESGLAPGPKITAISPHSNMNSMRPPPRRSQPARGISSQNIDRQALQQYHTRRDDFALNNMAPMFPSSGTTDLFNFTDMLHGQGSHRWQDVQMAEGQDLPEVCQVCKGTRIVSVNPQVQEECLSCSIFYNMQN